MTRSRRHHRFAASLLTAGLVALVGCADDSADEQPTAAGPASSAPSGGSASSAAPSSTAAAVSNDFALRYTGGTAGKADPSQPPVVVGYVNQEGGVPAYPEATTGVEAAVKYVNEELGGVKGRPVQLKKCIVQTEEDGQKCGTEMANDNSVNLVMTGTLVVGNQSLYSVLSDKKPTIIGSPVTAPDFTTAGTYAFTPGSPGVIQGMAVFIAQNFPNAKKVAVVHSDNAAGKVAAEQLFKPVLAKRGITDVTLVAVPDTATGPDLASAIQAAGGDKADVFVPLVTTPGCIATYDALQSLGISPPVVSTGLCYGTQMTQHLKDLGSNGQVPDGWYFGGYGYSYFLPDDASGMSTYMAKVRQYGGPDVQYTGFAGPAFANLLTAVKLMNQVGPDNATPDVLRQAIQGFKGPMMLVAGPMNCGANPVFKSLCGTQMGVEQYKDGQWVSVADALNGKPIDPSAQP